LEVHADTEVASFGKKSSKGPKTGVHLRYHKGPEYNRLSDEEKDELREWRKTQKLDGKNRKKNRGNKPAFKSTDKAIAAAVKKKVEAKMKALADNKTKEGEAEAFVISCLEKYATGKVLPPKPTTTVTLAPVQATFLKSILQRAKNTPP
jgi:hypothetical protein